MGQAKRLALITVLIWSSGALLGRLIAARSQFLLLGLSTSCTLLTFVGYRLLLRRSGGASGPWIRPRYLFFGLFGYFLYMVSLNKSFRAFDAASEAMVLNYTWPLFTVVFTRGVFQRRTVAGQPRAHGAALWEALGILLGLGAVAVLATQGDLRSLDLANPAGILWGLGAGISYGFFSGYSSTVPREEHGAFLFSAIAASWLLMSLVSLLELDLVAQLTARDVAVVLVQGGLNNGVGYITWTRANRLAQEQGLRIASVASLTFALPLLNSVWIALILREATLWQPYFVLSLILIVASYLLCQNAERFARTAGAPASVRVWPN
jgi:drug/metabolite transporter (DMT)-like permease